MKFQLSKSTSNLNDVVYGGRPRGEEPHVTRKIKKKIEQVEYIVRVDLVSIPKFTHINYNQILPIYINPINKCNYFKHLIFLYLQDELKIDDDLFEDYQSVYKLFDIDRDGILNFKEYEKLLRCLGYRLNGKR